MSEFLHVQRDIDNRHAIKIIDLNIHQNLCRHKNHITQKNREEINSFVRSQTIHTIHNVAHHSYCVDESLLFLVFYLQLMKI